MPEQLAELNDTQLGGFLGRLFKDG